MEPAMNTRELAPPRPTVGRIVRYYPTGVQGDVPGKLKGVAAIITDVYSPDAATIELQTFGSWVGSEVKRSVQFSETPRLGCWSWPPRE